MIKSLVFQLCRALAHCHKLNVLHRDIKPENLLVSAGTLKLCDFGFSRIWTNSQQPLTDYVATRWYRAPEVLLRTGHYGFPADLWAVGCLMGEMASGKPLFPGETELEQFFMIQKALGPLPSAQLDLVRSQFGNLRIPALNSHCTLKGRYQHKLSKEGLAFMSELLSIDPTNRLTAAAALQHSYFHDVQRFHRSVPKLKEPHIRMARFSRKPLQRSNFSNSNLLHKHLEPSIHSKVKHSTDASVKLLKWQWKPIQPQNIQPGFALKALHVRKLSRGRRVLPPSRFNSTVC